MTLFRFLEATGFTRGLIVNRFGGHQNLRAHVGLKPRSRVAKKVDDESLLADLLRVWRGTGGPDGGPFPTVAVYNKTGRFSAATAYTRWGDWGRVQEEVRAFARRTDPSAGVAGGDGRGTR